jgi:hypothetical protein
MTHRCTLASGKCIVFPQQGRLLAIPTTVIAAASVTVGNMTNGKYVDALSEFINLTVLTASSVDFYNVYHNNLTTIRMNYFAGTATSMTIAPTQKPYLFLRNFMNTATVTLKGLFTNSHIKAFYLNAPQDVASWDKTYCNATLASPSNNPYPTRLLC